MNIKVSKNETREFYGNELSNGIKFLNIKDVNLDKTTVVVTVNIGSLADTSEFLGLAHFLEHMLFLGSNKYPNENEFSKFISDNGGFTNAFTANTQTTYYFSIFNELLEKALDMFSQFFKSPLFNADSVDREINAVHSEHTKNIMDDSWRLDYFKDIISRQGSIVNRFKTGNLSSLQKEGLRDEMIQFYNNYYIPSNISIVTASSLENKTTSSMISNIFSNIESKGNNNITITKPLYNSGIESFFLKSIRDKNTLMYLFEIPLLNDNYNSTHSPWIISSIFTSTNKESLKQFLINLGLIKSLYCYVNDEGIFIVQIELSDISNWQTVDSYIKFYVNNLKHQNWHEITEYSKKKDILFFNYSSKEDTLNLALNISSNLFKYPIEKVILGSQVVETIDLGQIEELINNYLTFDNVKIILSSNSLPNLDNIHFGEIMTEEFYNLKYYPINLDFLDEQGFEFEIITNNEFINTKPEVIKGLDSNTEPSLIKINNNKIWFGNLSKFNEAIVISELIFTNLEIIFEMSRYIDTSILLQYIVSKFKEELYLASEIGFNTSFGIDSYNSQIIISISGYNDNFNLYFNNAIEFIKNFTYNPEDNLLITSIIKEKIDHYKNINKKSPWKYLSYLENLVLNSYSFTYNEAITYLETIDIIELSRKINEIKNRILYQSKFTAFIYGNIEYSTLFESNNNINLNFPSIEKPRNTLRILHDINESHPNNKEKDNLVKYSFYIGQFEPIKIIYSIILNVGLSNIFYNDLRTKQQFGYIVESHLTEYQLKYYFVQLVQSTKSIEEIETAINNFNNTFLEKINEDDFNTFVETVIKTLNEKETKMTDYYFKYLKEIKNNTFTFNRKKLLLKNIKNINFNNFKKFFQDTVNEQNKIKSIIRSN